MSGESQEEWRPVPGYEDLYLISNLGRFATVARHVPTAWGKRYVRHRILKTQIDRYGYPTITFCRDRKWAVKTIHRLLVQVFVGPIPDGMVVNHKDSDKTNNRLENLEICTQQWNAIHSRRIAKTNIGADNYNAKLTDDIVFGCRLANSNGESVYGLARKFGVCFGVMWHACHIRGRTWRHVPWPSRERSPPPSSCP